MRCGILRSWRLMILAGCAIVLASTAQGAMRTAASLSQADVQKAIDAAADGDIVELPAGKAAWTGTVTVQGKFLTIQGAGIDKTTIVAGDDAPDATRPMRRVLEITAKPGGLTRLTAMTIDGGSGAHDGYNKGMVAISGGSKTWRVDHIRFRANRTCAMHVLASGGVIDHCRFDLVGWTFGIYGFNGGSHYGDAAWAEATDLGKGDKAFFIEDNVFAATDRSFALDGWSGQRVVVRHNVFKNAMIGNHGTESGSRWRGARSFEIYENVIEYSGPNWPSAIAFRSGTGVVFNNRIRGDFQMAAHVDNYRDWRSFAPWGIASGESPFDKNDVDAAGKPIVYDAGVHTGASGAPALTCAGKKWTADQWRGYSVFNTTTGKSSIITSNTADTLVARIDTSYGGVNLVWKSGDRFKIQRCLVALDQTGRGKGSLISGDTPAPAAWPQQELDPAYVWNNTLGGRAGKMHSGSPHVREGVDFFNGTPKPGYAPYTYPHPLVRQP